MKNSYIYLRILVFILGFFLHVNYIKADTQTTNQSQGASQGNSQSQGQGVGDVVVGGSNNGNLNYSPNQNQNQNGNQNINQIQQINRAGLLAPGVSGGGSTNTVVGSPSAFANTHLFNAPWNFTPPAILFHSSKTINDGSIFNCCRIVNIGAQVRRGIKDRLFGIYDEREFIASGGPGGPPFVGPVIACGLNTQLSAGCVNYVGTGYVFMEEYASTEAALVSLSAMAARNGANIVGNVNCAFAETIRTYSTSLGASFGFSDGVGQDGSVGTSAGASWGTSRVKRPVQPHCTGDFYVGNASGCYAMANNQTYFPQPVPYRRYLPPPQYAQQQAAYQQPVRGLW